MYEDVSVVVAGAGLAGLVAANHLAERGADVTVYEERDEVGGRVRSRQVNGFTIDRGFQVLFTAYPAVRRNLDLDALDLRTFTPGAAIARPGSVTALSDPLRERDPRSILESVSTREVTVSDKLRTLALRQHVMGMEERELFDGPDRSIRSYLREWGFSEKYLSNFVAPFYGGITLDRTLSTSKFVFEYTFRALSKGEIAVPAAGMGAIPEQLAAKARKAGVTIETGEAVREIEDEGDGDVFVRTESGGRTVDAVVVATDPKSARSLTSVESIPTEARGCVTQYYRLPEGTDLGVGKKLLLNAAEPEPNTVVPMSAVAPGHAPPSAELLNATFLGDGARNRDPDELAERARGALDSWFPKRTFDRLEVVATEYVPFAQFAQPPGVHEALPGPRDPGGRTYLAGDYTRWSSIQGAMESGHAAAEAVLTDSV